MPGFPVDTGRKLNVHKTFRRRPGRLLNVLCTLNLRPVPTGLSLDKHVVYNVLQSCGWSCCFRSHISTWVCTSNTHPPSPILLLRAAYVIHRLLTKSIIFQNCFKRL